MKKKMNLSTQLKYANFGIGIALLFVFIIFICMFAKDMREGIMDSELSKLKSILEIVEVKMNYYKNQAATGAMTVEEAKARAIRAVEDFRYDGGTNYVWLNDYNVRMLVNPTKKVGEDCSNVKDPDGKAFYRELTEEAIKNGSAKMSYKWVKAGESKTKYYGKMSYAVRIDGWNWIAATGVYTDGVDAKINKILMSIIILVVISQVIFQGVLFALFSYIIKTLNSSVDDIIESERGVTGVMNKLEDASHALSASTEEQAATVESIVSTVNETASMITKTDENTKYVAALSKDTKKSTEHSYEEMKSLINAMDNINNSNAEISKIIKVIDEIAFQTNILSLNAAVEAARAGEAGKGFAVVAEEVRNLAQRSAEAAKDTAQLIRSNEALYSDCNKIVDQVNNSISQISVDMGKVDSLIQEVAAATHEQEIGMHQLNNAVEQINAAMHENAKIATQTSTLSEELKVQTNRINNQLSSLHY